MSAETNSLPLGTNTSSDIFGNTSIQRDLTLPVTQLGGSSNQNLVFIDSNLAETSILSSSFENAEVFLLNPNIDGIAQITNVLAQYQNVASVHIVSHGNAGDVLLGNSHLNLANISSYSSDLQSWSHALTTDADVLLYGCNVGAGGDGQSFIQQLSQITGADIAASNDLTGNAALGGDWELEVNTGTIESSSVLDSQAIAQYQSILPIYNGKNYILTNGSKTWENAQAEAQSLGGNLVTINDAAEETWLKSTFGSNQQFWIGFTDKDVEGQFKWVNGEATTYTNWAPGEPNNRGGNENYAVMNWGSTGKWNDLPSTVVRRGLIEVAPASLALEKNTYSINETAGSLVIGVVRSNDSTDKATVQYRVDCGTAVADSDFTATSGTLTFGVGETSKTFTIPIINDTLIEGNETFTLVIESPTGADLGTIRTASVTLIDDESTVLTISEPEVNENAGNAIITVTRGNGVGTGTVDFTTVDGTAIAGSDYQATSGQLTFADGETSKTITIGLINDTIGEPDETFTIQFTNLVGVTLQDTSLNTVTIIDDDPGSFIRETFISGLNQPTAFVRTPDNSLMYILEKSGIIKVAQGNTVLATRFIDLRQDVNNVRDRGALGLAIHPDFFNGSPYIYVSYTYDPPEAYLNTNPTTTLDDPDRAGNRPARVVRITADATNGYRTAVANSQVVIVGKNSTWANTSRPDGNSTTDFSIPESGRTTDGGYVQDYIKTDSESHTMGQLAFGADGALYVSVGDGTSYNGRDARSASVLNLDSLSGKILRVDPLTGQGLADNPFFNGDPNSNRSKVWNLGLRNPFRFTIKPGTSTPFIGDVGWSTWEEVNVGTSGANFGWPAYEGGTNAVNLVNLRQPSYDAANIPAIEALYNPDQVVTAPIYARNHSAGARAIVLGDFYDGNTFPSAYNDTVFVADVNEGTVDALTLNSENRVTAVRRFASGIPGIVYMETGPDGNLYYVNLGTNSIGRWRPV
jgi:glucose/arabinose dehydrogenase